MYAGTEIGRRIKKLREGKGLTQEMFAKEFHVRRETVSQWERGERDIKTEYTVSLAKYFGVTCDYILTGVSSDHVDIYRATGMTDRAIERLQRAVESEDVQFCNFISYLVEHADRNRILAAVRQFASVPHGSTCRAEINDQHFEVPAQDIFKLIATDTMWELIIGYIAEEQQGGGTDHATEK